MEFVIYTVGVYARNLDEGIVFGVARSAAQIESVPIMGRKICRHGFNRAKDSNSASAHMKPGGIEAPVTIPSSPEM